VDEDVEGERRQQKMRDGREFEEDGAGKMVMARF
jgi:hypothetical protein